MADPVKAAPLPEGGTIGVAAASSPYENRSEIDRGIRWYEQHGYRVKLAPGALTAELRRKLRPRSACGNCAFQRPATCL